MYINSMGNYVPSARITNEYFENLNGLEPGWILQRTGIISRSKAASDEGADSMALAAIDDALGNLPYALKDVDLIVAACYAAYDTVATPAHVAQQHYDISGAKAVYVSVRSTIRITAMRRIIRQDTSGGMQLWHSSSARRGSRRMMSRYSMCSLRDSATLARVRKV